MRKPAENDSAQKVLSSWKRNISAIKSLELAWFLSTSKSIWIWLSECIFSSSLGFASCLCSTWQVSSYLGLEPLEAVPGVRAARWLRVAVSRDTAPWLLVCRERPPIWEAGKLLIALYEKYLWQCQWNLIPFILELTFIYFSFPVCGQAPVPQPS